MHHKNNSFQATLLSKFQLHRYASVSMEVSEEMSQEGASQESTASPEVEKSGSEPSFMWNMLLGSIRKGFPKAKQLKTKLLDEWMKDTNRRRHILMLVGF